MSEPIQTSITIGGKIRAAALRGLLDAINQQGMCFDWDEASTPDTIQDILDHVEEDNDRLVLTDNEANYGQCETLEEFCKSHGLTYIVHNDAKAEFDAENRYWTMGMQGERVVNATQGGDDLVNGDKIKEIINNGELPPSKRLEEIRKYIDANTTPGVEPFEVTPEDGIDLNDLPEYEEVTWYVVHNEQGVQFTLASELLAGAWLAAALSMGTLKDADITHYSIRKETDVPTKQPQPDRL
jgi:hypothetical protein